MTHQTVLMIARRAQRSQQADESPLEAFGRERAAYELERLLHIGRERGDLTVTGVDANGELLWSVVTA